MNMDWINEAKRIFESKRPEHFTNYTHCEECEEHNQTLINSSIDSISLDELGNLGWDPICFASEEGKKYYMPSFIRLSLESIDKEFYFGQFLLHLESDGPNNQFFLSCNSEQRTYLSSFIEFSISNYSAQIELNGYENEVLKVHGIWSNT